MPLERLEFDALSNAILGSINGPTESIVTIVLACFAVCSIVASLRAPDRRIDEPMMVGAAIMMLSYWALPYAYMNTIFFSQRWLPFGLVLLLLALPKPPWGRFISAATGLFCLALLSASTVHALHAWQDEHLPGFFSALEHIDSSDRVLALNLNDGSMYLKGRPGLQLFAYAQALRDADIHFSFTEHFSGPIQFRAPPSTNSERALVHSPGLATRINTAGYTKVLISGNSTIQQHFAKKLNLTPIAPSSGELWRIYRTNNHANSAM